MSLEPYDKKYVIAEESNNPNESDTKIRIKLFPVSNALKSSAPKIQPPSSSSEDEDEVEEGELVSNAPNPMSMNN